MRPSPSTLSAERLRHLLHYDAGTGLFVWRFGRRGVTAGKVAGYKSSHGYISIRVDGQYYQAHRLAWLYVYGEWPPAQLDHIDGHGDHNRIDNLRPATQTENNANSRRARNNISGYKGASYRRSRNKWRAAIVIAKKHLHLGYFDTAEEAHAAYAAAAAKYFGEYARTE